MESILLTIRKMLGIDEDYDGFDIEIIICINTALMSLSQLGIGPEDGFAITGVNETWTELFNGVTNIEAVKSYIYLQTRLAFDPPATSFLLESMFRQLTELSFRLNVQAEEVEE